MRTVMYKRLIVISAILILTATLLIRFYWIKPVEYKVIVVNKCSYEVAEFWETVYVGLTDASNDYDIKVDYMNANFEHQIDQQKEVILSAIESEPDVIVLVASDFYEIGPYAQQILDKGIKLLLMDSGVDVSSEEVSFVGTNNIKAGEHLGTLAKMDQAEGDKAVILAHYSGVQTADEREAGIKEGYGEDLIMGTYSCDSDETIAYEITKRLLTDEHNLSLIFATNETVTIGAGKAIRELEMEDKVNLYGFDGSKKHVQYLEQGIVDYTIIQTPYQMGYYSIANAAALAEGKFVKPFVETDFITISIDNMYEVGSREILFPFVNKN